MNARKKNTRKINRFARRLWACSTGRRSIYHCPFFSQWSSSFSLSLDCIAWIDNDSGNIELHLNSFFFLLHFFFSFFICPFSSSRKKKEPVRVESDKLELNYFRPSFLFSFQTLNLVNGSFCTDRWKEMRSMSQTRYLFKGQCLSLWATTVFFL